MHAAVDAAFDDEGVRGILEALDADLADAGRSNSLAGQAALR